MTRELPEWIGATPDTPIPPRVKVRIVNRQDNRCDECQQPFTGIRKPEFDHRPALINGGENRESRIVAVHEDCHDERTADDVAEKSKVYRMRAKHLGIPLRRKARWGWSG